MPETRTATSTSEANRVRAGHGLDLAAVRARVHLVAEVLELPAAEVRLAMRDEHSLIRFCGEYGQSVDWLLVGDVRGMIRERWRRHGAAPDVGDWRASLYRAPAAAEIAAHSPATFRRA